MSAPPVCAAATTTAGPRSVRHCLVIDDESDTVSVLAHHLRRLGFEVTVAANGEDAERHLHDASWDLVIVDVVLPDVDGRDLVPSIRALPQHPEVILTSVLNAGDLAGHPADALLPKPFRSADLTAAIESARKAA